jgi:hypothetical protein
VKVLLHIFLTNTLDGDEYSASRSGRFTPGESDGGDKLIRLMQIKHFAGTHLVDEGFFCSCLEKTSLSLVSEVQ